MLAADLWRTLHELWRLCNDCLAFCVWAGLGSVPSGKVWRQESSLSGAIVCCKTMERSVHDLYHTVQVAIHKPMRQSRRLYWALLPKWIFVSYTDLFLVNQLLASHHPWFSWFFAPDNQPIVVCFYSFLNEAVITVHDREVLLAECVGLERDR